MDKSEIKLWLQSVLSSRNFSEFSFEILGNTDKGAGYASDVLFVHVTGKKINSEIEELDLVLKCAKKSPAMRQKTAIKEIFLNEIVFFEQVIPKFVQFQKERGLSDLISDSVAQYYGKYVDDNVEIIGLGDLKKIGYVLNDAANALTRKHLDLVVEAYAKFHAISAAFQDQKREEFDELVKNITHKLFRRFMIDSNMSPVIKKDIQRVCECLKDKVDTKILEQYKNLENHVEFLLDEVYETRKLSTLIHGDSWNNNFLFYFAKNETKPSKAAILDWQLVELSTPIRDLSYFLISCISEEDIDDLNTIITNYYETFSGYLRKLGSDPEKLYPRHVFYQEWKKFSKFALFCAQIVVKIYTGKKEDIKNIDEALEEGGDMTDVFDRDVESNPEFGRRMKYLVEYAAKNGLLEI